MGRAGTSSASFAKSLFLLCFLSRVPLGFIRRDQRFIAGAEGLSIFHPAAISGGQFGGQAIAPGGDFGLQSRVVDAIEAFAGIEFEIEVLFAVDSRQPDEFGFSFPISTPLNSIRKTPTQPPPRIHGRGARQKQIQSNLLPPRSLRLCGESLFLSSCFLRAFAASWLPPTKKPPGHIDGPVEVKINETGRTT
jgi:hypothetical protein